MVMALLVLVLGGLVAGSFLTVVGSDGQGLSWMTRRRSSCPRCGHALGVLDLVPLASFFWLRGRCRFCHQPIPRWHLAVEVGTVAAFLLAYLSGARGAELAFLLASLAVLLALTVTDLRFFSLPDTLVGILAVAGILRSAVLGVPAYDDSLLGGLLGLLLLGVLTLATRERAMGWGDVKLAGAMGLLLGLGPLLIALLLAFTAGGIVGGILLALKRATPKSRIPFGPFLAGATALLLLVPSFYGAVLLFFGLG